MKRLIAGIAAGVLGLLSGAAVAASPALAVPSCGSGYICFYNALDGTSLLAKVAASSYVRTYCYKSTSGKIPSATSYIVNDSGSSFVVSTVSTCGPTTGPIYAYSHGAMNATFSDHMLSIYKA